MLSPKINVDILMFRGIFWHVLLNSFTQIFGVYQLNFSLSNLGFKALRRFTK